jgi:hypothetical protein
MIRLKKIKRVLTSEYFCLVALILLGLIIVCLNAR